MGEETLFSFDDYHREKLPNELEEIILEYSVNYDADIRIRFSKGFMFTDIKIGLRCDGAKEIALGIKSEIEAILFENRTIHYIFYGKFAWIACGIFWVAFNGATWRLVKFPYSDQVWLFLSLATLAYYPIRLASPYTDFDTKNKERRDKFISWLLNGMAGVFVFGVIAIYFREKML